MEQVRFVASSMPLKAVRGDEMVEPDEVAAMLRLKGLGCAVGVELDEGGLDEIEITGLVLVRLEDPPFADHGAFLCHHQPKAAASV